MGYLPCRIEVFGANGNKSLLCFDSLELLSISSFPIEELRSCSGRAQKVLALLFSYQRRSEKRKAHKGGLASIRFT